MTIRVDSKVVAETDLEGARNDKSRWMRFTLDIIGKRDKTPDTQGRPVYAEGFEDLARLDRPVGCINPSVTLRRRTSWVSPPSRRVVEVIRRSAGREG
jgi:hypothetical protein